MGPCISVFLMNSKYSMAKSRFGGLFHIPGFVCFGCHHSWKKRSTLKLDLKGNFINYLINYKVKQARVS